MKARFHLLFLLTALIGHAGWSQTESTLYFMNSLPQVVEANPAIMPRYKLSIGLPGISSVAGVYTNNGFSYDDLISKTNGVTNADLSKWTQGLAEKNYVALAGQVDLLRFGYRVKPNLYLMFSSTVKGYNSTMIEKGLALLLVDGTSSFVNSYTNTSPEEEAIAFMQTAIGAAYQVNQKLTVGGRLKYINGISNVTTESSSLIIEVGDTYQITATGAARVRSSGISSLNKSGNDFGNYLADSFSNSGFGMDLGATYKFVDKLTVGASITDFGFITWKNDTKLYTLDPAKAKYTFAGFDINKLLNNDKGYLEAQKDSIQSRFEMQESSSGSYTTSLPTKFYLSGNYELTNTFSVGALFFGEQFGSRFSTGMTAAVNKNFGKIVSTSLTYTVSNRSYNNIGLGVSFNMQPMQLFFVGDNLLMAPVSLAADQNLNAYINSTQLLTLRAGLNIVFGWDKGISKESRTEDKSHNPKSNSSNAKVKSTYGRSPEKPKKKK